MLLQVLSLEEEAVACACGHVAVFLCVHLYQNRDVTVMPLMPAQHRRLQQEHLVMPSYKILGFKMLLSWV